MIGFIKWLIQEYRDYKVSTIIKPSAQDIEKLQMRNYARCLEVGFSHKQILALMNFIEMKGGTK